MNSEHALFIPDGDTFVPTGLTRGGWSDDAQHGGPPTGLLARCIERLDAVVPMQVVRLTVDLFRAVPLTPLTVETHVLREGRRIRLTEAVLRDGDLEVARGRALALRTREIPLPPSPNPPWEPPPGPDAGTPVDWPALHDWGGLPRFHVDAVEIRSIEGSFLRLGPGLSWFRLLPQVVAGEEPTPLVRMATLADMGNGNSQAVDARRWLFVNPDVTLHVHRLLEGEWLGMRSIAVQHPTGLGFADTELFDAKGPLGRVAQTQLVEPH